MSFAKQVNFGKSIALHIGIIQFEIAVFSPLDRVYELCDLVADIFTRATLKLLTLPFPNENENERSIHQFEIQLS